MKDSPYYKTYWVIVARHTDTRWLGRPNARIEQIFQTGKEAWDYYFENSYYWDLENWEFNVEEVKITPVQ